MLFGRRPQSFLSLSLNKPGKRTAALGSAELLRFSGPIFRGSCEGESEVVGERSSSTSVFMMSSAGIAVGSTCSSPSSISLLLRRGRVCPILGVITMMTSGVEGVEGSRLSLAQSSRC